MRSYGVPGHPRTVVVTEQIGKKNRRVFDRRPGGVFPGCDSSPRFTLERDCLRVGVRGKMAPLPFGGCFRAFPSGLARKRRASRCVFLTAVFRPGQRHLRRSGSAQGAGGPVGRAPATCLGLLPGQPSSQRAPGELLQTVGISKEFPPTFSHFSPVKLDKNKRESGIKSLAPGGNV